MPLTELEQAIKSALISGDSLAVNTLKGVKSALQYEAVAKQKKLPDLTEEEIAVVLGRELKKRREAAELYAKAGQTERADKEKSEGEIIAAFLPKQLSDEEINEVIKQKVNETLGGEIPTMADMGKIIGTVKSQTGAQADGAAISRLVKVFIESNNQ